MATSRKVMEQTDGDDGDSASPWWSPALAVLLWAGLWYLTPGLHHRGLGAFVAEESTSVLLESAFAMAALVVLMLLQRRRIAELFARDRTVWLYALPVLLAPALPFHYTLPLPVGVYLVWMACSVLWQDCITFGLLQSHLRDRFPLAATIPVIAVVFYLGHALLIPELFGPTNVLPALGILAMGAVCAAIRARTGTLHLLLALHLSFYYLFA